MRTSTASSGSGWVDGPAHANPLGTAPALRPFTEDDADYILALLNDPDWLRFIGDKQVRTQAHAQRYLRERPIAMVAQPLVLRWGR